MNLEQSSDSYEPYKKDPDAETAKELERITENMRQLGLAALGCDYVRLRALEAENEVLREQNFAMNARLAEIFDHVEFDLKGLIESHKKATKECEGNSCDYVIAWETAIERIMALRGA